MADSERSVRFYPDVLGVILVRRRWTDAEYITRQASRNGQATHATIGGGVVLKWTTQPRR